MEKKKDFLHTRFHLWLNTSPLFAKCLFVSALFSQAVVLTKSRFLTCPRKHAMTYSLYKRTDQTLSKPPSQRSTDPSNICQAATRLLVRIFYHKLGRESLAAHLLL